jgi:signal transduction histidine kinase
VGGLTAEFSAASFTNSTSKAKAVAICSTVNPSANKPGTDSNNALYEKAIKVGLESLKMFDLVLPEKPKQQSIKSAAKKVEKSLRGRAIADLEFLPSMDKLEQQIMVKLLINMIPPTYITNQDLMVLVIIEMTNLCLQYGNTPLSGFVYLWYGTVLCAVFSEYEKGDIFGSLGLALNEKANLFAIKGKVLMTFGSFISHWRRPLAEGLDWIKSSFQPALEAGELSWCFHGASFNFWKKFLVYDELESLVAEQDRLTEFAEKKEPPAGLALAIQHQVLLNLQGKLPEKFSLDGETFKETSALKVFADTQYLYGMSTYYFAKAFLHFNYGDYTAAYQLGLTAEKTHASLYSQFQLVLHDFYQALSLAQIYRKTGETTGSELLEKLELYRQKFQLWADNCQENYRTFFWLLEAEIARVKENRVEAVEYYDRAIAAAKENKYLQLEALANELAAKFCLDWGKEKVAGSYMQDAYYCYLRWGALAKVEDLETRHPNLIAPILERQQLVFTAGKTIDTLTGTSIAKTSSEVWEMLDLATLMKASRTLSEHIELEKAIASLIQVARENAGAETAALMLFEKQALMLSALVAGEKPPQMEPVPVETSNAVPLSIVNQVKHRREPLVLDDASKAAAYAGDTYIISSQPRSILCLPLKARGHFIGILYLENNRVRGAFTRDRVEVLTLLCSQAAISLENARLYQQSQNYSLQLQEYLQQLQEAQLQLVQNEKMATIGQLVAGIAHEINNPVGFISGNLDYASEYVRDLMELVELYQQGQDWNSETTQKKIEEIELDYLLEDLPELISSMKEGTHRIAEISKSMRTFSRSDTAEKVLFNLHDGIDSTLLILKHRLKANEYRPEIQVVKNYGSLPEINCYPGQLNQVFMNLIANGIDALEEANSGLNFEEIKNRQNRITITTKIDRNKKNAVVRIGDNGPGMSEEVKQNIFDNLFTTKAVGKGTGLGLSISRKIVVEKHGGSLTCTSEVGKGTEFAIALPL